MKSEIVRIFTALTELESKGCHAVFFEYGNSLLHARIYRGEAHEEQCLYNRVINPEREPAELDKLLDFIETLKRRILTTVFLCYKRKFVEGKMAGRWEATRPVIEFGENATEAMNMDGSGYLIDDPANGMQYFVDMNILSELK
jgi:hypothetical protein